MLNWFLPWNFRRFDIKWAAPEAEESFNDARGDIIILHDSFTVNSSSVAFDLSMKVQTSYRDEYYWLRGKDCDVRNGAFLTIEGVELDFRMRGFEFLSLISSNSFDSPRPMHLKATGRIKLHGKVLKDTRIANQKVPGTDKKLVDTATLDNETIRSFVGDILLSGIKLNQLMLAPQLVGSLSISPENIKVRLQTSTFEQILSLSFSVETYSVCQTSQLFSLHEQLEMHFPQNITLLKKAER